MSKYTKRRDYLVGKLINGAYAVNSLFDAIILDENLNPITEGSTIKNRYNLTNSQAEKLDNIIDDILEAKKRVDYYKRKYGVTGQRSIKDKKGLFKEVFEEYPPKSKFTAETFSFAIGFFLPQDYFEESRIGEAAINYKSFKNYNQIFSKQLKDVKTPAKYGLFFTLNYQLADPRSLESRGYQILTGLSLAHSTVLHELKHLIDEIIMASDMYFKEISADLFINYPDLSDSRLRDAESFKRSLDSSYLTLQELIEKRAPKSIIDDAQMQIKEKERKLQLIENFPIDIFNKLKREGLDYKVMSYIVAMTSFDKLQHRLELIDDYLERLC